MRLIKARADSRALFEALATDAPTATQWATGFCAAARSVFQVPEVYVQWLEHDGAFEQFDCLTTTGFDLSLEHLAQLSDRVPLQAMMGAVYARELQVIDVQSALRRAGFEAEGDELLRFYGLAQMGGVPMSPLLGLHVVLCWASADRLFTTTADDLRLLRRLTLHFENGVRLRTTGIVEGELSLDGEHCDCAPTSVVAALTTGKISLSKTGLGYRIVQTPASRRFTRSLTRDERTVLERAASGTPLKEVAFELAASPSRVSHLLGLASAKLGFPSSVDALRLIGGLLRPNVSRFASLTAAERDVLTLVKQGLSNRDIAVARQRSERTVANQVASLLRKTGLSGRRALISLVNQSFSQHATS